MKERLNMSQSLMKTCYVNLQACFSFKWVSLLKKCNWSLTNVESAVYFLCLILFILKDVTLYYRRNLLILIMGIFLSCLFIE